MGSASQPLAYLYPCCFCLSEMVKFLHLPQGTRLHRASSVQRGKQCQQTNRTERATGEESGRRYLSRAVDFCCHSILSEMGDLPG